MNYGRKEGVEKELRKWSISGPKAKGVDGSVGIRQDVKRYQNGVRHDNQKFLLCTKS